VGKRVITVITVIFIITGIPLAITAEITVTLRTRSNQINLSKNVGSILNFKIRFYNDVIVIKELNNIDITVLNDKTAMPGTTTLEASQPVNQILKCKKITHP